MAKRTNKNQNASTKTSKAGPQQSKAKAETENPILDFWDIYVSNVEETLPKLKTGSIDAINAYGAISNQLIDLGAQWFSQFTDDKENVERIAQTYRDINTKLNSVQKDISNSLFDLTDSNVDAAKKFKAKKSS